MAKGKKEGVVYVTVSFVESVDAAEDDVDTAAVDVLTAPVCSNADADFDLNLVSADPEPYSVDVPYLVVSELVWQCSSPAVVFENESIDVAETIDVLFG